MPFSSARSFLIPAVFAVAALAPLSAHATPVDDLRMPLAQNQEWQQAAGYELAQDMSQGMAEDDNDPFEGLNRGIFEFNQVVDGLFLKPAAQIYRGVLPQEAQDSVRDFLRNLRSPLTLANNLLQADMDAAGNTIARFLVNTTLGVAGLFDVASELGIPYRGEDFGQTLAVWGLGEGPYLMLPILGPSNVRDTSGLVAEWFADPVNYALENNDLEYLIYVRAGLTGLDARARNIEVLDQLERSSLDYYAAIRSLYRQRRADEIRNSRPDEPRPNLTRAEAALPDDIVSFRPSH